jgi:hypothetical protein
MPIMSAEQKRKRVQRAEAEVEKLTARRERLEAQLAATRTLLDEATAELDWWTRPGTGRQTAAPVVEAAGEGT